MLQRLNRVKAEKCCYSSDNERAAGNNGAAKSSKLARDPVGLEQYQNAEDHAKYHKRELRGK